MVEKKNVIIMLKWWARRSPNLTRARKAISCGIISCILENGLRNCYGNWTLDLPARACRIFLTLISKRRRESGLYLHAAVARWIGLSYSLGRSLRWDESFDGELFSARNWAVWYWWQILLNCALGSSGGWGCPAVGYCQEPCFKMQQDTSMDSWV